MNQLETSNDNVLGKTFHFSSLLRFALPTICMMIFMGLYTIVDTIFVSRFVNTYALSAINICSPVLYFIIGLASMLATGGSAIIGRKLGEGKINEASNTFTFIICFGCVFAIIITIFGILFLTPLLKVLGASSTLLPYCKEYLFIQFCFVIFNIVSALFQNLFVTAGKPSLGFISSIVSGILNIILDYIFIVIFDFGILGASLGTSIAYTITTIVGIIYFSKNKHGLHFVPPIFQKDVLLESCLNGSSEMVTQLSTAITTFFFNITMMRLVGEDGVAAITVIIYSQLLLTTLYIGFSIGVSPIFSFNYGCKNTVQLKNTFKICIQFLTISSISIFLLALLGGPIIANIFASKESAVYQLIIEGFRIFPFSFLFCGFNIFSSALFTALSNGKTSAIISFLRTFVFVTISIFTLSSLFGITGVWLAVPLAELLSLFIAIYCIYINKNKYHYL
ncbi:MAG: MATE family efflux transporter [Coprobacillaceae bacterium]